MQYLARIIVKILLITIYKFR